MRKNKSLTISTKKMMILLSNPLQIKVLNISEGRKIRGLTKPRLENNVIARGAKYRTLQFDTNNVGIFFSEEIERRSHRVD